MKDTPETQNCIFCKIVRGELPSEKVFENENFLAFLDINPKAPGHALVIPKEHHRWVWDVPNFSDYFEVARKIALAQRKAFDTDEIWSRIVGEEVPHAHIWLIPNAKSKKSGENDENNGPHENNSAKDFKTNAEKIRRSM